MEIPYLAQSKHPGISPIIAIRKQIADKYKLIEDDWLRLVGLVKVNLSEIEHHLSRCE